MLNLQVSVSFLKRKNCWIGRKFGARNGNAYQTIREFFVLSECLICYINRKSQLDKLNDKISIKIKNADNNEVWVVPVSFLMIKILLFVLLFID